MAKIERGIGFTPTEMNLAALADKIFLNLWSCPNLFNNEGKELCDLLVICGDDILIFSDKNINWPTNDDIKPCVVALVPPCDRGVGRADQRRGSLSAKKSRGTVLGRSSEREVPARSSIP